MSLTWAQIRMHSLSAMGGSAAAQTEIYDHLTEGYRYVATHPYVSVPELSAIDEMFEGAAGSDKIAISDLDFSIYAIQSVFNLTSGYMLYPDPGGMLGRERYLTTTGMPPEGAVTNYTRDGAYLYLRNTPDTKIDLRVRAVRQIPTIGDSDLNSSPLTPAQFDWTIIHAAAANYYKIHPAYSPTQDGSLGESLAEKFMGLADNSLMTSKPTEREQDRVRREVMSLRGYSLSPRTRRMGGW